MANNYQKLLNMPYRNFLGVLIIVLAVIILSIYIGHNYLYDRLDLMGVSDGENLVLMVPLTNSDTFSKKPVMKINNKTIDYTIISISEMLYDDTNNINYQTYTINIKKTYPINEIVKVSLYYNKEKIYKKVINMIKE